MRNKGTKFVALFLSVLLSFGIFAPMAAFGATTAHNRSELVNLISEGIKANQRTMAFAYPPGGLTKTSLSRIIEEAIGKNLRSICKTEGYSSVISGEKSDEVSIRFTYGKAKDYDCFLAPTLDDLYAIVAQSIGSGRINFAVFFPDERETQTLATIVDTLKQNLSFYESAGIDEYYMHNLLSYDIEPLDASETAGGFVVVCDFVYAETPQQTKYVWEETGRIIASLNLMGLTVEEKVARINEYVIGHTSYLDNGNDLSHSAYGLLTNRTAVCQGYALLTYALLIKAQIPCSFVEGYVINSGGQEIPHLWNVVKTPDGWLHLDTTWNGVEGSAEEYLLRDAEFMKRDHYWDESVLNDYSYEVKSENSLKQRDKTILLTIDDGYMKVGSQIREVDPGRGTKPIIVNDRTLLPIRGIIEAAGGSVLWNDEEKQVTINYKDYICDLWIGKREAILNGYEIVGDTEPQIVNDRTMIPLRFVAESFGLGVIYDEAKREVVIIY